MKSGDIDIVQVELDTRDCKGRKECPVPEREALMHMKVEDHVDDIADKSAVMHMKVEDPVDDIADKYTAAE